MNRFHYKASHPCPVCGKPVYDIPPFAHDCFDCAFWSVRLLAAGGAL